jgi:cytosolic iron-sulfur protein assembly protein CIAO1
MKMNVNVLDGVPTDDTLLPVHGTKVFGYGKVSPLLVTLMIADEDDEFECLAVLQEHTQDVKSVNWHPTEPILASCSYDDTIRLYYPDQDEFIPISVLKGHTSTVWGVAFEPVVNASPEDPDPSVRLASCSDDLSVIIWRRTDYYRPPAATSLSILRDPPSETWKPDITLPRIHDRVLYSVAWSESGLIASTGGDGKIVVYEEKDGKWVIKAVKEAAHGVCEVNCVIWGEHNTLWSTGDDGIVRKWQL